ncbi:MAG: OmpA family protein [Brevundimonas sp.]|nr:MAG: OmpA family protein [Brevundimonas sp.]
MSAAVRVGGASVLSLWAMLAALAAQQPSELPTPPPPAPMIVHGYVYFDSGSDVAEDDRLRALRIVVGRLISQVEEDPGLHHAYVMGMADTVGSSEDNLALSRRRALSVADEAIRLGVDPARIQVVSCGEALLNRPTADDVEEPLNRFVLFDWKVGSPLQSGGVCSLQSYSEARAAS